jgi:archaemetzincin
VVRRSRAANDLLGPRARRPRSQEITLAFVILFACASCGGGLSGLSTGGRSGPLRIAVLPFRGIDEKAVETVRSSLVERYAVEVEVLPERELPSTAYYEPRKRYRGTKLLEYLDSGDLARFDKVVGLTASDISVTRGEIYDWGIFGLGSVGGRPCIVSTFRLRGRGASAALIADRLGKITVHEAGHTFGLDHCPTVGCALQDCAGSIKTVDGWDGTFCSNCDTRLRDAGVLRE